MLRFRNIIFLTLRFRNISVRGGLRCLCVIVLRSLSPVCVCACPRLARCLACVRVVRCVRVVLCVSTRVVFVLRVASRIMFVRPCVVRCVLCRLVRALVGVGDCACSSAVLVWF